MDLPSSAVPRANKTAMSGHVTVPFAATALTVPFTPAAASSSSSSLSLLVTLTPSRPTRSFSLVAFLTSLITATNWVSRLAVSFTRSAKSPMRSPTAPERSLSS